MGKKAVFHQYLQRFQSLSFFLLNSLKKSANPQHMIVHQTSYLEIFFDTLRELFMMQWHRSPEDSSTFKREMLLFRDVYKKFRVPKTLWLHETFEFVMDQDTNAWTEKHIVHPCFEMGVEKFAFVISKDVFAHLSVIESFDGLDIPSFPRHFTSKDKALEWLLNDTSVLQKVQQPAKVTYNGLDNNDQITLTITSESGDAENLLRKLKSFNTSNIENIKRAKRFQLLSKRERQILQKYMQGDPVKQMSDSLNISVHTVRTHWRNIKKKLEIHNRVDASIYRDYYY